MLNRLRGPLAARRVERQQAQFYARFVDRGDLVFDIGANAGERTRVFRRIGARVVAVEPQPRRAAELEERYRDDPSVTVVPKAVASAAGTAELQLNREDALSSMSPRWMDSMERAGRLAELGSRWLGSCTVDVTTLDELVAEHGVPAFCKVDVEGSEPEIFAGISGKLRTVSFELAVPALELAIESVELLERRGASRFNLVLADRCEFDWPEWQPPSEAIRRLTSLTGRGTWGDVFARFGADG